MSDAEKVLAEDKKEEETEKKEFLAEAKAEAADDKKAEAQDASSDTAGKDAPLTKSEQKA